MSTDTPNPKRHLGRTDCRFSCGVIVLPPKTAAAKRTISLSSFLIDELETHMAEDRP